MKYFGTDGIRGIYNETLTDRIAFMTANALTENMKKKLFVVGRDTRTSGENLYENIKEGILAGGGTVINLGIIPTPAVAYITQLFSADFGLVISASHNPAEYNGVKLFNSGGVKLTRGEEEKIERHIDKDTPVFKKSKKTITISDEKVYAVYEKALIESIEGDLTGLKIVLDCSNGAAGSVAVSVFRSLGADVLVYNNSQNGKKINDGCGALYPEFIREKTLKHGASLGFAFDGDADRIIACGSNGRILDGDDIIYLLGTSLAEECLFAPKLIVGTILTNSGVENSLSEKGLTLIRTDVGDHNVAQEMIKLGALVGGEQSGHIINRKYSNTGDGVLTAILLSELYKKKNRRWELPEKFPQISVDYLTNKKKEIAESREMTEKVAETNANLGKDGRALVRASGTEKKLRIMVESRDAERAKKYTEEILLVAKSAENSMDID